MTSLSRPIVVVFLLSQCGTTAAETPPEQEAAVKALRGVASNIQKNRDGTVRFVRFSKPVVSDEHLQHLKAFEHLDYLAVIVPTVTDVGLANIAGLTNLDTLFASSTQLSDEGAATLRGLSKLQRLYLDQTQITDAGLKHLAELKQLDTLSLAGTKITDEGLAKLQTLQELASLYLTDTQVTDAGLACLAGMAKLKTLKLSGSAVSGPGLQHLKTLASLETLDLSRTRLEVGALERLAGIKSLKRLLLYDVTVTQPQRERLREVFPKCHLAFSPLPGNEESLFARFLSEGWSRQSFAPKSSSQSATTAQPVSPPIFDRLAAGEVVPDFQRHVVPLLGRLGCNGRNCHGSFQGRGGFRLSMFGYDFASDYAALVDEGRAEPMDPENSLVLLKPTLREDHEGGRRFDENGPEHELLSRWILNGAEGRLNDAPNLVRLHVKPDELVFRTDEDRSQLCVVAEWSDGVREDVTALSRFQTNDVGVAQVEDGGVVESTGAGDTHVIVMYDGGVVAVPVMRPVSEYVGERYPEVPTPTPIDKFVVQKLSKLGVVPSEFCSDEEFLRRVSLDVAGTLPTPEEIRSFVADKSTDKRARKIDELLESPAYVEWWTTLLCDLTGSNPQYLGTTDMNRPAATQWEAWMRRRVQDNMGWDQIAAGILLGNSRRPGQTYEEYAAEQSAYLRRSDPEDFAARDHSMHYYWFRSNLGQDADRALSFGYIFLGVRLQCAQCHKHPFDRWSKQDFEQFTNFFGRIKRGAAPDAIEAQQRLKTKLGVPKKLDTAALRRQMYMRVAAEGLPIPWNEIYVETPGSKPQIARLLGGDRLDLNDYADPREPLVRWLVSPDNPFFARAFVNRIWAHYFGSGIVDPPDDFNTGNPPTNKPLLDWLANQFAQRGYDVKWLHRTIAGSRTYQLSWEPNDANRTDLRSFSRAKIRRLPAEVVVDAIRQATANDAMLVRLASQVKDRKIAKHPLSIQARALDYSLLAFGKPLRTTNCDCERQGQPSLLQSLYLRNDQEVFEQLERKDGWLSQVADQLGQKLTPEVATGKHNAATAPAGRQVDGAMIDELVTSAYLRTVSRFPTDAELTQSKEHLAASENTVEGLRDLMWALLNTQEFLTNH